MGFIIFVFSKFLREVGFIIFSLLQIFGEGVFIIFSFPGSRIQWIFPDFGPLFERFPLKESHFGGPQNPKLLRLRRAFPPNRGVLADILGYLGVSALETADLGVRSRPTRSDPPPLQNLSSENKGGVGRIG